MAAVSHLINGHFLSRSVDLPSLMRYSNPLDILRSTVVRFGLPRPVGRILAESGRDTAVPYFLVGVYSGEVKLGEGVGTSLKMAQHRVSLSAFLSSRPFSFSQSLVD